MSEPSYAPVRWYTLARKFPQLVARTRDGTAIPGGPYTVTGFIAAAVVAYLLLQSWARWSPLLGNPVTAALFGVGAVYGTAWGVTRLPIEGRNPLTVAFGFVTLLCAPRAGRAAGRRLVRGGAPRVRAGRGAVLVMDCPREGIEDA